MRHSQFTVNGKPFFSIGGQTHNSSSYNQEDMDRAWKSVKALGGNTVATPVCWDAFEPKEGCFNEEYVKNLILQAREQGLKLVFLWFATWKNGTMEYCPAWVKEDIRRFQRVVCYDGSITAVLSSHCEENRKADCRAFCRLMELLKAFDGEEQTVIAVQVENEPGILGGTRRDFSPAGNAAFNAEVPAELIQYAKTHEAGQLAVAYKQTGSKPIGNWAEVFGEFGAEAVTAWSIANYIDSIACEGKKIYDLFLYANVWLDGGSGRRGWDVAGMDYPSGGAVSRALDIWYCACKSIDTIAPDNYQTEYFKHYEVSDTYSHPETGYPLYVPESHAGMLNSSLMFYAIAEKQAIGYHIFGTESVFDEEGNLREGARAMSRSMHMISAVIPLLQKFRGTGRIQSIIQHAGMEERFLRLPGWKCRISFAGPGYGWNAMDYRHAKAIAEEGKGIQDFNAEKGRGLLIQVSENEFYLVGHKLRLMFSRPDPVDGHIPVLMANPGLLSNNSGYLELTEGHFDERGEYVADRVRSGDEARHGIWAQADCGVVHFILAAQ